MAKERSSKRASELRKRAEKILASAPQTIRTMVPADIQKLIQELNVHQIELEMQNDELGRVQLKLQEARDKYLDLYDFAPTGYFTLDQSSLIVDVNLAGSELLGSEKHRLIGAQFTASISPDSQDAFYFDSREVLKTGSKGSCELKMLKADGTPFHAQLIIMAVPEKDGNINQLRTAVIDITERKQMEVERLELERKAQNASRLASIGEMAAGIAHEINNPLTPILGFAGMLLKKDLPVDIKDDLQIIHDSARRTADVVRRLLLFARQSKPMRTLCNINEVVETTLQLRDYHLKTNSIKVITELDPELPQTMADAGQLQQVVLNLIMNAEYSMVHARGGGNLLIKTEKMGNIICLSVKDDGPGISKGNMEKLFTPFFSTKKVGEGTGLGLSACHGIIAEHNGRIYAESEVGKGATFIVELPIIRQQKEEEAKVSESDRREAGEAVKARILVVDDEPTIVQVLNRVLTGEGYEVESTGKAKAALGLIKGGKYALILLDIKLPDMSGIELYQHLDKTDKSLRQRIIFVTGDVLGTDTMDFFSRTGASYVTKPFDMEQLKKEIKSKLTKRG